MMELGFIVIRIGTGSNTDAKSLAMNEEVYDEKVELFFSSRGKLTKIFKGNSGHGIEGRSESQSCRKPFYY